MFHSTMIAPGTGPFVSNTSSEISTVPDSPGLPTLNNGRGLFWSPKFGPVAIIIGKSSPVIFKLMGIWMVLLMIYAPWSKYAI